jgi:heme a synthase
MFGSCLVWIGTLRVLLALRERPEGVVDVPGPAAEAALTRA